jgi:peptide/nickel transport system permease protein
MTTMDAWQAGGSGLSRMARNAIHGLGNMPLSVLLCLALLATFVLAAVFAPFLVDQSPTYQNLAGRMRPPAWATGGTIEHLLGTDRLGRDIFSRLLYGARISLSVAALSILFGGSVGTLLGLWAGYRGGIVDAVVMRSVDVLLALPTLLVAIVLAVAIGPSFWNVVFVVSFLLWPKIARQIRGEVLAVREQDYVKYAEGIGRGRIFVMLRHLLPNVTPSLIVVSTLELGHVVLLEASLSFIGAGVPPPHPSWGVMVDEGRALLATGWWLSLFPGLAIMMTVLIFNTLGDWLRDTLDPRLKLR